MTQNLQPWICTYLLYVAETHGGDFLKVSSEERKKMVQVVKFLTPHDLKNDHWVWAVVSDKTNTVPVRFGKGAMEEFNKHPLYGGQSLSDYETVIMKISKYRPMFTRIPIAQGTMSAESQLALEVDAFEVYGSITQVVYGAPREVESNINIREWTEGLREGGGGGNVLKLRKLERQKAAEREASAPNDGAGQRIAKRHTLDVSRTRTSLPILLPEASTSTSAPPRRHSERPAPVAVDARVRAKVHTKRNRQLWLHRWNLEAPRVVLDEPLDLTNALYPVPASRKALGDVDPPAPRSPPSRKKRETVLSLPFSPPSSPPPPATSTSTSRRTGRRSRKERATTPSQWSSSEAGDQLLHNLSWYSSPPRGSEGHDEGDEGGREAGPSAWVLGGVPSSSQDSTSVRQDEGIRPLSDKELASSPPHPVRREASPQPHHLSSSPHVVDRNAGDETVVDAMHVDHETGEQGAPGKLKMDVDEDLEDDTTLLPSSSIPLPTPAQRTGRPSFIGPLNAPPPLRDPAASPELSVKEHSSSLPSGILPLPPSYHTGTLPSSLPPPSVPPSRPPAHQRFPPLADTSIGKVLVPDSDPSNSQSHSHSHSHSDPSNTQNLVQSQVQSQPNGDSQESARSLMGPQQSLSYTSAQSQDLSSQSQARSEAPVAEGRHVEGTIALETALEQSEAVPARDAREAEEDHAHAELPETDDHPYAEGQSENEVIALTTPLHEAKELDEVSLGDSSSSESTSEEQAGYESVPGEPESDEEEGDADDESEDVPQGAAVEGEEGDESESESEDQLDSDDEQIREKIQSARMDVDVDGGVTRMTAGGNVTQEALVQEDAEPTRGDIIRPHHDVPSSKDSGPSILQQERRMVHAGADASTSSRLLVPAQGHEMTKPDALRASIGRSVAATSLAPAPAHDPESWAQPSFRRSRSRQAPQKRKGRSESDSDDKNEPASKRQKLEISRQPPKQTPTVTAAVRKAESMPLPAPTTIQVASAVRSVAKKTPQVGLISRSSAPSLARPVDNNALRGVAGPSKAHSTPSTSDRDSTKGPSSALRSIRHIDFRALGSPATTTTVADAKRRRRGTSSPSDSGGQSQAAFSAAVRSSGLRNPPELPGRPGPSDAEGSRSATSIAGHGRALPSVESASASKSERPVSTEERSSRAHRDSGVPLLDLRMTRQEGGPPYVTWRDLSAILLRTGKARHKEQRNAQRERGQGS